MIYNLLSVLYLLAFAFAGVIIFRGTRWVKDAMTEVWLGGVLGLVLLLWLPALVSFATGKFNLLSQMLALAVVVIALGIMLIVGKKPPVLPCPCKKDWIALLLFVVPMWAISILLLSTHTIVNRDGALWVGQSTYGDLSMHLGFITSITRQETFPPHYSICPDTTIGYPFLSDSISSTFYTLGASLRFATMLPAIYALLLVFLGAYLFFKAWLKKRSTAVFASYLSFVGGGFGFWYFFDLAKINPGNFSRIFTAFYETPTNDIADGIRWVNPIADMLIPQRATLFGWALLFACLYLLYKAAFEQETKLFLPLGILAGSLPLVHTHSFLALGILSCFYLIGCIVRREGKARLLGFCKYALFALLLAGPQLLLFTFRQSQAGGFLQWHWNWCNVSDSYIWFYIKNFGLLFLLLPIAFCFCSKEDRGVFGGGICIWAISELVQFQPNSYDNNKLLFVCFFLICGIVAKYLSAVYEKITADTPLTRVGKGLLTAVTGTALFLSGILTLGRELVSEYQLIDKDHVDMAAYVDQFAEKDATFLTYNNHNNAIAVLTGRDIVCGSGTFLFYHGVDYSAREQALSLMYSQPELYFDSLSNQYSVDYVLVGPYERANYIVNEQYFKDSFEVFYGGDNANITIYRVNPAP